MIVVIKEIPFINQYRFLRLSTFRKSVKRFSEKIMLDQKTKSAMAIKPPSRFCPQGRTEEVETVGEGWGVLSAVLSSGLGGTSIGATRYLVKVIDPLAIGSFRFGIGVLLLLPLGWLRGDRWPATRDWLSAALLGLLYFALFPVLFNASLIYTTCLLYTSDAADE